MQMQIQDTPYAPLWVPVPRPSDAVCCHSLFFAGDFKVGLLSLCTFVPTSTSSSLPRSVMETLDILHHVFRLPSEPFWINFGLVSLFSSEYGIQDTLAGLIKELDQQITNQWITTWNTKTHVPSSGLSSLFTFPTTSQQFQVLIRPSRFLERATISVLHIQFGTGIYMLQCKLATCCHTSYLAATAATWTSLSPTCISPCPACPVLHHRLDHSTEN